MDEGFERAIAEAELGTLTPDADGMVRYGYDGNIRPAGWPEESLEGFDAGQRRLLADLMIQAWNAWAETGHP
jgi:hypothetical protein